MLECNCKLVMQKTFVIVLLSCLLICMFSIRINDPIDSALKQKLWNPIDAYDATFNLMVPMHAAYRNGNEVRVKQFCDFFTRFTSDYDKDSYQQLDKIGFLNRLQFLYLVSEFLVLEKEYRHRLHPILQNIVLHELKLAWESPAWWYSQCVDNAKSRSDGFFFDKGMKERLFWKINANKKISYCTAVIDEEWFAFAIAADLYYLKAQSKQQIFFLKDILNMTYLTIFKGVKSKNAISQGWVFQPGVWSDHPDYAYAGNTDIRQGLKKSKITNITPDSSHATRWPLLLNSLARAYGSSKDYELQVEFTRNLRIGLLNQFLNVIMVKPDNSFLGYRTKNFTDGNNGVFRYKYDLTGTNLGYGPFQLSGTLFLGWWIFLPQNLDRDSRQLKKLYCDLARDFPVSRKLLNAYKDRGSTIKKNPIFFQSNAFQNRLYWKITLDACSML